MPPSTLEIVYGDGQRVPRTGVNVPGGVARFAPLAVRVADEAGRGLEGEQVTFAVAAHAKGMAVQLDVFAHASTAVATDLDGVARLDRIYGSSAQCIYGEGPFTVVARAEPDLSATFSLTVSPTPPPEPVVGGTLTVVAGDRQTLPRTGYGERGGTAEFAPLRVRALRGDGTPAAGEVVEFSPGTHPHPMAVQVHPSGAWPAGVVTDAQGHATLAAMPGGKSVYAYFADGPFTVVARLPGGAEATFSLRVGR